MFSPLMEVYIWSVLFSSCFYAASVKSAVSAHDKTGTSDGVDNTVGANNVMGHPWFKQQPCPTGAPEKIGMLGEI